MGAFDSAWTLLKLLPSDMDDDNTVFYEDFGPVPVEDYYNADWHINHPNPHIHEDLPPRDELQAELDREKEMADYRKVMDAPPPRPTPQMDDDPFRMKRPDIESQIEEMAAEIGRRRGRKDAVREDKMNEKDPGLHGLDEHLRQNYFKNLFDRENPQNPRLINFTAPQMREREAALNAELDRRAEKRRSF